MYVNLKMGFFTASNEYYFKLSTISCRGISATYAGQMMYFYGDAFSLCFRCIACFVCHVLLIDVKIGKQSGCRFMLTVSINFVL